MGLCNTQRYLTDGTTKNRITEMGPCLFEATKATKPKTASTTINEEKNMKTNKQFPMRWWQRERKTDNRTRVWLIKVYRYYGRKNNIHFPGIKIHEMQQQTRNTTKIRAKHITTLLRTLLLYLALSPLRYVEQHAKQNFNLVQSLYLHPVCACDGIHLIHKFSDPNHISGKQLLYTLRIQ